MERSEAKPVVVEMLSTIAPVVGMDHVPEIKLDRAVLSKRGYSPSMQSCFGAAFRRLMSLGRVAPNGRFVRPII